VIENIEVVLYKQFADDVLVVLVPPLHAIVVGVEVRVEDADTAVIEHEPRGHATLVSLQLRSRTKEKGMRGMFSQEV
jgi:hypothetical protein